MAKALSKMDKHDVGLELVTRCGRPTLRTSAHRPLKTPPVNPPFRPSVLREECWQSGLIELVTQCGRSTPQHTALLKHPC